MNKRKYEFYDNPRVDSIVELIERASDLYGDSVAIRYKQNKVLNEKTYNELLLDSKNIAKYLLNQPFQKGHIAILGSSSYEWITTYLGTVFAGLVIVPLDKELPANELVDLIMQADVECLFYDEQYANVVDTFIEKFNLNISFVSMNKLYSLTYNEKSIPGVVPDKLSTILFTSGTTGKSKGVMLTQKNIASNVIQGLGAVNLQHRKDIIMSVLPMNHAYEFTCTILGMLYKGVTICISSGLRYLQKELIEYKPTVMFIVPLFAETLYKKVELNIKKQKKEKAFAMAVKFNNFFNKLHIDLTDKLFKEIKEAFGGRLRIIMCGGAPLSENLIQKYNDIGINLFQGFGLTECSPLLTVNFDYYHRPNSVGKVVSGNEVKVVDSEIWARGISVSKGYYNNPIETSKSFEDGWFKTGDLGYIDKDDFVFIIGRKKNLIILDNGKNVSAEELEKYIYEIPCVCEVIVYGENNRIVAEICVEPEKHHISNDELNNEINKINKKLPTYKNIDKVIIRDVPFEKTTTKKIKRYRG